MWSRALLICYQECPLSNFLKNYSSNNQENHNMNEKRQSIDANNEMNQMLELSDNYVKAIKKILQSFTNFLETEDK